MRHESLITQFRDDLATLSRQVELSNASGHYDINKMCENVFCELIKGLYGYSELRNLNMEDQPNFPGIDLADDKAKVAIQVTSDKSLKKIKETIEMFINKGMYTKYDKLVVCIITKKQDSYSEESIEHACQNKITFNAKDNIIDCRDLAAKSTRIPPPNLEKVARILRSYLRDQNTDLSEQEFNPPKSPPETLTANLIEIHFPDTIYMAEILSEALGSERIKKRREAIWEYAKKVDRRIPSCFIEREKRIITFVNLENQNPFDFMMDKGTTEPLRADEFFDIDDDHERSFKHLLRNSLQHKLYKHGVSWQHEIQRFIFIPFDKSDDEKKIQWTGAKKTTRRVFKRMYKKEKPDEILSQMHLAFSINFHKIDSRWYMSITPDWFFSFGDSYRRSYYGDKLVSGRKRMETNRSVFDHFRFLCWWLKEIDSQDLFSDDSDETPQITFSDTLESKGGRCLDEKLWAPLESESSVLSNELPGLEL